MAWRCHSKVRDLLRDSARNDAVWKDELFRAEQITLAVNSVSKSRSKPYSPLGMSFTESVMSCLPHKFLKFQHIQSTYSSPVSCRIYIYFIILPMWIHQLLHQLLQRHGQQVPAPLVSVGIPRLGHENQAFVMSDMAFYRHLDNEVDNEVDNQDKALHFEKS